MLRLTLALLALTCAGCGTVQSALVPVALEPVIPHSHGRAELHVRETTLTGVERSTAPSFTALYLPRVQVDGGGSVRLSQYFALRISGGSALDVGAMAAGASTARQPGRAAWYSSVSPAFTFPLDHGRTQLGASVDVTGVFVPFVLDDRWECGEPEAPRTCGGSSDHTWLALMLGGSFSVSRWVAEGVRLAGSAGVRVQPTLDDAFATEARAPTGLGYVAFAFQAEARFQMVDELALAIDAQWVAPVGPYTLYPTIGVALHGTFGDGPGEDPRRPETWIELP